MEELYPRLKSLTLLARQYDIGINIDAEGPIALNLPRSAGKTLFRGLNWQAGTASVLLFRLIKTLPLVIDYLIDLATRSRRRLMIRGERRVLG